MKVGWAVTEKGLGELWETVKEDLEKLVECYEKVNKVTSLGQISRLRRIAVGKAEVKRKTVLDAGAGPGYITAEALKQGAVIVFTLDPLERMIEEELRTLSDYSRVKYEPIQGVFEEMPLKDNSVDAVVSSFALRDAYDLERAVGEIARVLKPKGKVVILDFYKPESRTKAKLIELYLRVGFPILSILAGCAKPSLYTNLYKTYRKHLSGEEYVKLFRKHFRKVHIETRMFGVMILEASNKY
ncbi:MAG: class I SAM-dependent methyltransferase [Desulfurococcales archaeon]|nr:class I SAM-dependent methyltransferase [Desulfurococcales archaeon]